MYSYTNPPLRRGRRSLGGCLTGILLILLLLAGGLFLFNRVKNGTTLSVGAHPTIVSSECTGKVVVQSGPANQVTVSGILPQYNYVAATNTITFSEQSCDDLTMTVPPETNLTLSADEITVIGVQGTMKLDVNGGRITLLQTTLEGKSEISDNGGPVIFMGKLGDGSLSTFDCNSGSLDLTLLGQPSYTLRIEGILGPFISSVPEVQINPDDTEIQPIKVGDQAAFTNLKLSLNDTSVVFNRA